MKKRTIGVAAALIVSACAAPGLFAGNTESAVTYTQPAECVEPGGTFDVVIGFDNIDNAVGYAVMLDDSGIDESVCSMLGIYFEEIGRYPAAIFEPDPSDFNDVGAAYLNETDLDGDYVRYSITIPETAESGSVLDFAFTTKVLDKNNKDISASSETIISVTVGSSYTSGSPVISVVPDTTELWTNGTDRDVVYTVKVAPPKANIVGGFGFTITAPQGMVLSDVSTSTEGGDGYWVNEGLHYTTSNEDGLFRTFSYTPVSDTKGTFTAGKAKFVMTSERVIMTIRAEIEDITKVDSYALSVSGVSVTSNAAGTNQYDPFNVLVASEAVSVKIPPYIEVQGISLDRGSVTLREGGKVTLNAEVTPDGATDSTVTWHSSDSAVATVDANGTVTARGVGKAVITASAGSFSAECSVTVNAAGDEILGDINLDGEVTIDDALLLFQYSMLPDVYEIAYEGGLDFTKDGDVTIDDALLLFQYSMLPDIYPLA